MAAVDWGQGQAAGLRNIVRPRPVRVISITSGKGGVGKTNVSVNLAMALAQQRKQVMLMDADLGLANIDVLLGLRAPYNLSHVLSGERTLEEVLITGPGGFRIIPASSGLKRMAELTPAEHAGVIAAFSELNDAIDVLLVDTAAGISDSVVTFSRASQDVVVVVCDEPASITDAYALIKLLSRDFDIGRFRILANRVASTQDGRELFNKLLRVTDRYLDVTLDFFGAVPNDPQLYRAVQAQRAVVEAFPNSRAAGAFQRLAAQIDRWPKPSAANGHLQFFIERLVNAAQADEVSLP